MTNNILLTFHYFCTNFIIQHNSLSLNYPLLKLYLNYLDKGFLSLVNFFICSDSFLYFCFQESIQLQCFRFPNFSSIMLFFLVSSINQLFYKVEKELQFNHYIHFLGLLTCYLPYHYDFNLILF